jgi:chromosome segregation ATPase
MGNEHSIGGNLDSGGDAKLQAGDDVVVPRESPTSCVTWPATTPNGSANNTSAFSAFVPTETTTTTAPVVLDETPQSHDSQNEEVAQALRLERDALQASLTQAQAQRTKMQGKLRAKSARISQLEAQLVKARTETAAATANVARLADEKESMRAGLVCLAATRDDYKARWQMQRQVSQDLRGQVAATQQRTKAAVARQQREAELLALYRTLSLRTGYQQLGKAIRTLEHELASLVVADEE